METNKKRIGRWPSAATAFLTILAVLVTTLFAAASFCSADTAESEILFQDNFDDPDTSLTDRGWIDADDGTGTQMAPIVEGKVLLYNASNSATLFLPADKLKNVSDYMVDVDITWPVQDSYHKNSHMSAIIVRNTKTGEPSDGYEFSLFQDSKGKYIRMYGRSVGGASVNVKKNFDFQPGETVHFRVVVKESHFECFINGTAMPLFTLDHSGIAKGGIGFKVTNGSAYYDNLVVRLLPSETESSDETGGSGSSSSSSSSSSTTSTTTRPSVSRPAPVAISNINTPVTKDTGFAETEQNVAVRANPGVVPAGAALVALENTSVPAGSLAQVQEKYGEKAAIGTAYVLSLEDAQGQPLENLTLKSALSANIQLSGAYRNMNSLKLVYLESDGTPTEMEAVFEKGCVTFDTDKLGYYALVMPQGRPHTEDEEPGETTTPATGVSQMMALSVLTLALVALTVMLLMLRSRRAKG